MKINFWHGDIFLKKEIISIVVPVYNVEKYLNRCVNSLINQSYDNLEIILVDDGSHDSSPAICDYLAKKDDRIKVIHKRNGGLSSARNAGIYIAKGKYIGFVDSDDDVESDMYEKMFSIAEQYNVDFVMSDYKRIESDEHQYLKTLDIDKGYYNRQKIINNVFPNLIMSENLEYGPLLSVWNCLYRREFLKKNRLVFDEKVRWSEDNIFSAIAGYNCQSFYYMKGEALYHYYNNPGSITTSYRKGAWVVYSIMNKHLHKYFDNVSDYDFHRQLKLHLMFYACNCTNQEALLPRKQAITGIRDILDSRQLMDAFSGFKMPNVNFKLKLQLYLIKYRKSRLLFYIKRR